MVYHSNNFMNRGIYHSCNLSLYTDGCSKSMIYDGERLFLRRSINCAVTLCEIRFIHEMLLRDYTSLYLVCRISRLKKVYLRKMFTYWSKLAGLGNYPTMYIDYDFISSYPMYNGCRSDIRFVTGNLGCYVRYSTFFVRNVKGLSSSQRRLFKTLYLH